MRRNLCYKVLFYRNEWRYYSKDRLNSVYDRYYIRTIMAVLLMKSRLVRTVPGVFDTVGDLIGNIELRAGSIS